MGLGVFEDGIVDVSVEYVFCVFGSIVCRGFCFFFFDVRYRLGFFVGLGG